MNDLAQRIRGVRAYAGLSQPEMAERLGMSEATYKRIESGKRDLGEYERSGLLQAIAGACGVPVQIFSIREEQIVATGLSAEDSYERMEASAPVAAGDINTMEARLNARLDALETLVRGMGDPTREVVDASRGVTRAVVDQLDAAAEAPPAADRTRDGGDASPGSPEAPPRGNAAGARKPAR